MLQGLFGKQQPLQDGGVVTVDENYIRESIRNPTAKVVAGFQPIMPVYPDAQLSEEQILQLIAYIRSLSPDAGGGGGATTGATTGAGGATTTTGGLPVESLRSNPVGPTDPRAGTGAANASPGARTGGAAQGQEQGQGQNRNNPPPR